jgi:hypothetical protein
MDEMDRICGLYGEEEICVKKNLAVKIVRKGKLEKPGR